MKKIRESTKEQLAQNGCEDVPVFLIDSYEFQKFEFEQLEHRLVEEFPDLKRAALVLSLQVMNKEMIHLKVAALRSRMWKPAMLSGASAAIPVPVLSIVLDYRVVAGEADFYKQQLGLDEASLRRYAKLTNTDYEELKSIVQRSLDRKVVVVGGIKELIERTSPAVVEGIKRIHLLRLWKELTN